MQHSQLLNTTTGHFDELYVRVPPSNDYADVASTVTAVATLEVDGAANAQDLAQQAEDIEALTNKDNTLQDFDQHQTERTHRALPHQAC